MKCEDTPPEDPDALWCWLPDQVWCEHGVDLLVNDCVNCDAEDFEFAASVPYAGNA